MRKKVDVQHLRIGMYVEELDRPWMGTPFLLQGVLIKTPEDIRELQQLCEYVYISDNSPKPLFTGDLGGTPSLVPRTTPVPAKRRADMFGRAGGTGLAEEVRHARALRGDAKTLIGNIEEDIRLGRSIDTDAAKALVREMVDSVVANPEAMLWLSHLRNRDEYSAIHSMNVCVLSTIFGRHLGMSVPELNDLALGALLHDIGKVRIPASVLNKPGRLTDAEFEWMRQHPRFGVNVLKRSRGLPDSVLDVVLNHHERVNGRGYPGGLAGEKLSRPARIAAIADVYDALCSDRIYHRGQPPPEVMKVMYAARGKDFDEDLMEEFVQCLGIFPRGSLVELNTGAVGVVVSTNPEHILSPVVTLMLDESKRRLYPPQVVNLARCESGPDRQVIRRVLSSGTYNLSPTDLVEELAGFMGGG